MSVLVKFILCQEELPQVDTNFHSSEADNENSDFDTVELEKNDTSDENIDEDTPSVLEISNVTLIGERELNDECMTSCLEAESTVLSAKVRFSSLFFGGDWKKCSKIKSGQ